MLALRPFVWLHVPEREGALEHMDAVAVRTFVLRSRIRGDDVETIHFDMACAHFSAREYLDTAGRPHA